MKQLNFAFALALLLLQSCISNTEQAGLDLIADNYSGKATYSKDFNTSTESGTSNTFTIELSNSKVLDTLQKEFASTSIASMLVENFSNEDRYDKIVVNIVHSETNESEGYTFTPTKLLDVVDQTEIFNSFSESLLKMEYSTIAKNVLPEYQNPDLAGNLETFMGNLIKIHGDPVDFIRTETSIRTTDDDEELYRFDGHLHFKDGYVRPYFVTTSTFVEDNYIAGYNLEL